MPLTSVDIYLRLQVIQIQLTTTQGVMQRSYMDLTGDQIIKCTQRNAKTLDNITDLLENIHADILELEAKEKKPE